MAMRAATRLLLALALGASAAARADEVTDQLDQASRYYQDGDITGAIGELEFVLQALRGRIGQELLATFPAPPDGWTAETADDAGPRSCSAAERSQPNSRSPDSSISRCAFCTISRLAYSSLMCVSARTKRCSLRPSG